MIYSYADLIDAIRDWLGRANDTTNLPASRLGDLVLAAETEIYDRLRVREMEVVSDYVSGDAYATLPAEFIEMRRVIVNTQPSVTLEFQAPPQFWTTIADQVPGRPRYYTIEGPSLILGPVPDDAYEIRLLYYQRLPPLALGGYNSIFERRPHLFLYGALVHAAPFVQDDERVGVWKALFENALAQAQSASDRAVSGAPLVIRRG